MFRVTPCIINLYFYSKKLDQEDDLKDKIEHIQWGPEICGMNVFGNVKVFYICLKMFKDLIDIL